MLGIYVHIPFCAKKCPYCDFYSVGYSKGKAIAYANAVIRNLEYYSQYNVQADTLYFGGGTPSLMPVESIRDIITTARACYSMPTDSEITLEANPRTLNANKLQSLRSFGVNRLSIGVQSCVDSELETLGRHHTFKDCEDVVNTARACGFENISCDLMVGTPFQTMDTLKYSCEKLSSLDIQHISSYMLKVEDDTPFGKDASLPEKLPLDDTVSDMYLQTVETFESFGFKQYEVSNFAKLGFESRHNLKYWQCVDYLGIGSGAHSCFGGTRFCVPNDVETFTQSTYQPTSTTESNPYTFEEVAMLSLRLTTGLDTKEYPQYATALLQKARPLARLGYLTIQDGVVTLTSKGFLVSNSIIETLVLE